MIRVSGVTKSFGGRRVVDVPDLTLGRHGIEGLIGPNGAGKTTLMNLIGGRLALDRGQILWTSESDPVELSAMRPDQIARLGIVKTNQLIQDFESLTIMDSLLLALATSGHEKFYKLFNDGALREETRQIISLYLDELHFDDPNGHALSAGEKKLLDIVRCTMLEPRYLLMDEPTAGLPDHLTARVMEFMRTRVAATGTSVLIVEHNLDLIWAACDWVFFMADGEMVVEGPPESIRGDRVLAEKYLGTPHA